MSDLVQRAKELAYRAHAGQVDKAGRPYIEHVSRVAAAVRSDGRCGKMTCDEGELLSYSPGFPCPECDEAEAVAWLHDVIEDCLGFYSDVLSISESVSYSCLLLTRNLADSADEYYSSIRLNSIALRVKLADIADNADESRLALLDDKTADRLRRKYAKAFKALGQ